MTTFRKPRQDQKLNITGIGDVPKLPADYAQVTWTELETNLKELVALRKMTSGRESMYQKVTTLCNNDNGKFILEKLMDFIRHYINAEMSDLERFGSDLHSFTEKYDSHWDKFQNNLQSILNVFMFLDGDIRNKREKGIWERSHTLYRELFLQNNEIYNKVLESIMSLIYEERANEQDNKLILQKLVQMLAKLGLYNERFFPMFIKDTEAFYYSITKVWFDSLNISEYLRLVEKSLRKEQERIVNYLGSHSTEDSILSVERIMVKEMTCNILEKGLQELIGFNKIPELTLLYKLIKKVNELEALKKYFSEVVKQAGSAIMTSQEENKNLITELLDFQEKIDNIMIQAFENSIAFKFLNKTVWEGFLNIEKKIALEIAKDFDDHLKKDHKVRLTESEMEKRFNGMINIFKLINSKDIFEAVYFNKLAKRLLLDKSRSNDLEKSVVSKLKSECGSGFIIRLRNIQNDMEFSKTFNENFKQNYKPNIEFNAWVLTESGWPKSSIIKPLLPGSLKRIQDSFNEYYTSSLNKRLLIWNTNMSYCEIQCNLKHGNKSITVSFHQTLMLLLFNEKDALSISSISSLTDIPVEMCIVELTQLCSKCRILKKEGEGKKLDRDSVMMFNEGFKHKLYKITVNTFQIKESLAETNNTIEKVLSERLYIIDAAIVRVMKTRKSLLFKDLLKEVFSSLRFDISTNDVKKRIETLVEREYMRRDDGDKNLFHYIS